MPISSAAQSLTKRVTPWSREFLILCHFCAASCSTSLILCDLAANDRHRHAHRCSVASARSAASIKRAISAQFRYLDFVVPAHKQTSCSRQPVFTLYKAIFCKYSGNSANSSPSCYLTHEFSSRRQRYKGAVINPVQSQMPNPRIDLFKRDRDVSDCREVRAIAGHRGEARNVAPPAVAPEPACRRLCGLARAWGFILL